MGHQNHTTTTNTPEDETGSEPDYCNRFSTDFSFGNEPKVGYKAGSLSDSEFYSCEFEDVMKKNYEKFGGLFEENAWPACPNSEFREAKTLLISIKQMSWNEAC